MAGIPENAQQIWNYLTGQGLSDNAAAGILGNIEQESGGDPAAGPWPHQYGLIQWTPPTNYFSSRPSLSQQLPAIIDYINANGSIDDINAHADTPANAALYFSQQYERPNPSEANNQNREDSATLIAQQAKVPGGFGGTVKPHKGETKRVSSIPNPVSGISDAIGSLLSPLDNIGSFFSALAWMTQASSWLRIIAGAFGFIFLISGGALFAVGMGA